MPSCIAGADPVRLLCSHGPAVHPRHLSIWEKWVCGYHKQVPPLYGCKLLQLLGYRALCCMLLSAELPACLSSFQTTVQ